MFLAKFERHSVVKVFMIEKFELKVTVLYPADTILVSRIIFVVPLLGHFFPGLDSFNQKLIKFQNYYLLDMLFSLKEMYMWFVRLMVLATS